MFAQIGSVRFEGLKTFESFSRQYSTTYSEHAHLVGKPGLQFGGEALECMSIGLSLHAAFCTPEDEVKALNAYRATGEILPIVLGTGEYLGNFVITDISQDYIKTDSSGSIILTYLSVSLKEYYDADKLETRERAAIDNAEAIQGDNVKALRIIEPAKPTPTMQAAKDVKDIKDSSRRIDGFVKEVGKYPDRAAFYYNKMQIELEQIQKKCASVTNILSTVDELRNAVPNFQSVINSHSFVASTFQSSLPPGSYNDLLNMNGAFQTSVGNTNKESSRLNSLLGIRKF